MDLTARHIHEKQFHDAWRGYNQEEVDDFLDRVADQMGRLERENDSLQVRLRELDQAMEASRSTEDMLKKTLVTAQQAAEEAISTAKRKAEALVAEAETRAQRANDELKHRVATAEEEVRRKTAEAERQQLARRRETQQSIERLEAFEVEIKRRLKAFLEQQSNALETLVDKGPGGDTTGEVRMPGSPTPRLRSAPVGVRWEPPAAPPPDQPAAEAGSGAVAIQEVDEPDQAGIPVQGPNGHAHDDEGDDAPKRPLRGIFRRDDQKEEWAEEGR